MSYNRTSGKGGTRNSVRERHADRFLPNYNKSKGSGRVMRGKRKDNPTKDDDTGGRAAARFSMMMNQARDPGATEAGRRPKRSRVDKLLGGKSGITDFD